MEDRARVWARGLGLVAKGLARTSAIGDNHLLNIIPCFHLFFENGPQ